VSSVYANSLLRYQRKLKRDNPESEYSYRDFINKDITEYNFGIIRSLGEQSDSLIINERSFDHLYQNIDDRILSRISISH